MVAERPLRIWLGQNWWSVPKDSMEYIYAVATRLQIPSSFPVFPSDSLTFWSKPVPSVKGNCWHAKERYSNTWSWRVNEHLIVKLSFRFWRNSPSFPKFPQFPSFEPRSHSFCWKGICSLAQWCPLPFESYFDQVRWGIHLWSNPIASGVVCAFHCWPSGARLGTPPILMIRLVLFVSLVLWRCEPDSLIPRLRIPLLVFILPYELAIATFRMPKCTS